MCDSSVNFCCESKLTKKPKIIPEDDMKNQKWKSLLASAVLAGLCTTAVNAATWNVTIKNLTHANHFTPLFLQAHDASTSLFTVGGTASSAIELMAECGATSELVTAAGTGNFVNNPVKILDPSAEPGFLNPGLSTSATINTDATGETHLSVVSMILPTNDAFIGLESQLIPTEAGTYTYYVNGYDAGTEGNDEILNATGCDSTTVGMPGAPGGDADSSASGVSTADTNTNIHVHRGVLGEATADGTGISDLVNHIHRWQNPVAEITVTVTP